MMYGDQWGRDYDREAFAKWESDLNEGKFATPEEAYDEGARIIYPWYGVRGRIKDYFGREPEGFPSWTFGGRRG